MKRVEAIVRPERMNAVKAALDGIGFPSITFTQVVGRDLGGAAEPNIDMLPKVKVDVVVPDDAVERTIDAIVSAARLGFPGDGKVFVIPVDEVVRVRTGERGNPAI